MVKLADQLRRKDTSEVVTGTMGFIDDYGKETRAVIEAIFSGDAEDGLHFRPSRRSTQVP